MTDRSGRKKMLVAACRVMNPLRIIVAVWLAGVFSLAAQPDAPAPNVDSLVGELNLLEQKQKQKKQSAKAAILARIQAAAANGPAAAVFYGDAIEEVQFRGRKDKVEAYQDWKKKNSDYLRTRELQTALLFHLRYLALALQRKGIEKPETLLPATMTYLGELVAESPQDQQGLLSKPLGQSVIAQWLQLGDWLPDSKVWEPSAGDVGGILEKNIRPILRDAKDPRLLQTWDLEMKMQADAITSGRLAHQADVFNAVTRQRLIFQRAQDMIILGQPNRALGEMLGLVRSYPEHPDFPQWMAKIREQINRPAATAGTSPQ